MLYYFIQGDLDKERLLSMALSCLKKGLMMMIKIVFG